MPDAKARNKQCRAWNTCPTYEVVVKAGWVGYGCLALTIPLSVMARDEPETGDTFQPFVSDHLTYDDNLFRLANQVDPDKVLQPGMSKSDIINQLSAGTRIDYRVSRQRLLIDLRVDDNRFVNNQGLNNVSTSDRATWKWKIGKNWSWDMGYGYKRSLASFAYTQFFLKDMLSEHNAFANLEYTWHPRWKINTGLRWLDSTHSNELRSFLDLQSITGLIGLTYATPANNSVGLEYRYTDADLPNRKLTDFALVDNHYRSQNASAVMAWRLTGKTQLEGRFGYTTLENRHFTARDFSGPTWRVSLNWSATAKTQLNLSTWRDLQPSQTVDASYMVAQGVGLFPSWRVTEKLSLSGRISYESVDFEGDPGLASGVLGVRRDKVLTGRLGLNYTPLKHIELGLAYQAERRTSSRQLADFDDNSVFGSVAVRF
jgi:exopolysaccharide biosynthesis operon protein EpsL